MTGSRCIVCKSTRTKDPGVRFHHLPADAAVRAKWISRLQINPSEVKPHTRVCSRHFPGGDATKDPQLSFGKCFASPAKKDHPRAKRAKAREACRSMQFKTPSASPSSNRSVTPAAEPSPAALEPPVLTASVGEQFEQDYLVHELPSDSLDPQPVSQASSSKDMSYPGTSKSTEVLVVTALVARIEALEAEKQELQEKLSRSEESGKCFRLESISHDDNLVRFYTGFVSYFVFCAFFYFLGPVVNHLKYLGEKEGDRQRHRGRKLDSRNHFLLLLVKLKLNLRLTDLAFHFGISRSSVSRYLNT